MTIFVKNKHSLQVDNFKFKCCIGKRGSTNKKKEGDKKTPKGLFNLGRVFFRKDRINKPETKLECISIKKNLGWCDDVRDKKNYNKLVNRSKVKKSEKLYRKDYKYDLLIPIKYNTDSRISGKGSAIFIHLTKNYKATAGCIALKKKDFLIMLKIINKKTKINIF